MDKELKKLLIEREKLRGELLGRKKTRGMQFYIPNRIQYKAHKSKCKVICVVKGNRMGGTTWGVMELSYHLTRDYPDWFPVERRYDHSIKVRVATDKFFKIDSVIEPKMRDFIPLSWWKGARVRRSPQGYITKIQHEDGSFIEFLTMEQDQMAFEGQDLDLFWGDEPVERRRYVATQRGLVDRSGQTLLSFTPLIEPWMKEEIVDKADGKNIDVFYGSTRDNMFDIEGNPILREADIKRFEDTLTEDEKETRIRGKFFHLRGIVYKEFSPDVHLVDPDDAAYERGAPVICVLDPHDRQPHHIIWAWIDKINDVYVMYEKVMEGTVKELAATIKATEKYFEWNVRKRLIDPNFGRKPLISTGLSVIEELRKYRVHFTEANDSKEAGRLRVKDMLHYRKDKPVGLGNKPKLFFLRGMCPQTVRSVMNLQYDEWKGADDRDPKEDTKQKDTHGADCVRYLCADNPEYEQPMIYEPDVAGAYN